VLPGGIAPERLLAHKDYLTAGLPWALSSDNKPYSMLFALWVAAARVEMHEGKVIGPSQQVSIAEALRAMTAAGAYASFEEHHRGTLEAGKLADLVVVLPGDLLTAEPESLPTLRPLLTMVGGRVAHADPSVG
jgi:predicted amidohydrolase YtcJ